MKKSSDPNDLPPVFLSPRFQFIGDPVTHRIWDCHVENCVENPISYLHDSDGMLESRVRGPRVYLVTHCKLVDATQALKGLRVNEPLLQIIERYEAMNPVTHLVPHFRHARDFLF